jgi:hypothetical protein
MVAADLRAAEAELEELGLLDRQLDTEVEQLEQRLEVAERREARNKEALGERLDQLTKLNEKLGAGAV